MVFIKRQFKPASALLAIRISVKMGKIIFILAFCFAFTAIKEASAVPFTAEIAPQKEAVTAQEPFFIAVKFNLESGWHSYWRNPGEAGEATKITLTLPEGFKAGEILWAVPEAFTTAGFKEFGYSGEVYHFLKITPPAEYKEAVIPIKAKVSLLLCGSECVPKEQELNFFLPVGQNGNLNPDFQNAYQKLPKPLAEKVYFISKGDKPELIFPFDLSPDARFFPYQDEIDIGIKPEIKGNRLILTKQKASFLPVDISGVLVHKDKSYEIIAYPEAAEDFLGLFGILLLAFVGGLILNFMPCVLPLLSLKILGIMRTEKEKVRRNSIAYAGGILFSFLIIAILINSLKGAGTSLGWGFQMQNVGFVFFLVGLMMILGLMFSGLIEVGTSLIRFGSGRHGAFASGILAVLLASPCVAPFMGTAMAYTLTAPPQTSFLVFAFMGLGLAFPFLALSLHTGWVKYMPKSGLWTKRLQEFLAFPLYAASVWLAWVLEKQVGQEGLYWALGLQLAIIAAALVKKKSLSIAVLAVFIAGLVFLKDNPKENQVLGGEYIRWQPYSEEVLNTARNEGKPVFLKFSAAWCLTCLVNDKLVLDTEETEKLFAGKNILPLAADWSAKDDSVTEALNRYGYNGVPLYVYYPAGTNTAPVILPQLLTGSMLLKALDGE